LLQFRRHWGLLAQREDHAAVFPADDQTIIPLQMVLYPLVVLQPPEGRGGEEQELGAFSPQRFQLGNRLSAVGGVVAGVHPALLLREVPAAPPLQRQQLFVPLAHHQDGRSLWHARPHRLADLMDQQFVVKVLSRCDPVGKGDGSSHDRGGLTVRFLPLAQRLVVAAQFRRLALGCLLRL
jgi:hypothetical protein